MEIFKLSITINQKNCISAFTFSKSLPGTPSFFIAITTNTVIIYNVFFHPLSHSFHISVSNTNSDHSSLPQPFTERITINIHCVHCVRICTVQSYTTLQSSMGSPGVFKTFYCSNIIKIGSLFSLQFIFSNDTIAN